jgi:hypothetical protein
VKYLTKVACGDIRYDGALNGLGEPTAGNPSGQLYIGSTALTVDWYRRALGQGVIAFGGNENNKTGLSATHFLEMANSIALSSSAVFDGEEGSPVDNEGPIVTSALAEGSLVNGTASLTFDVSDPLGVKTVGFYIDGNFYADAQPSNPVLNWTTTAYSDGEHTVKVVATDVLDNPTEREFTFTVANAGPGLTFTSPSLVNSTSYTATGTFSAVIADIERIVVDGVEATINRDEGTWVADIEIVPGVNSVPAEIVDTLGNRSAEEQTVSVDLIYPNLNVWDTQATFTNYDGLLNRCEYGELTEDSAQLRPVCLNAEKISLDGLPVSGSLDGDGYLLLGADIEDPQGVGVFSNTADLTVEYKYEVDGDLVQDWLPVARPNPGFRLVYVPIVTEYLGEDFYQVDRDVTHTVTLRVSDQAGNTRQKPYRFRLDVLTPAFELSQNIVNESLFEKEFSQRTTINGSNLVVEYTYDNASSLPYIIQVDPSNNSRVVQAYESAIRRNRARVVTSEEWRYRTRPLLNDDLSEWALTNAFYVYNGGAYTEFRVPDPQYGEYQWYDQEVVNPPQPAGWQ